MTTRELEDILIETGFKEVDKSGNFSIYESGEMFEKFRAYVDMRCKGVIDLRHRLGDGTFIERTGIIYYNKDRISIFEILNNFDNVIIKFKEIKGGSND